MSKMIRIQTILALVASFALAPVFAVEEGEAAPDFTLPALQEGKAAFSLSDMQGKAVFVDFWASWCAPCLMSLPLYNEMYHKYKDQGLEVVAINVDNPIEDGLDFLLDTPLDFTIPADPDGEIPELYGVFGMPTSYLIAPDGTVSLVHVGYRNGDIETIEEAVKSVLPGN